MYTFNSVPFHYYCQQHSRAELHTVSKLDEVSLNMAAGRLHMTHTMQHILRVTGDLKNTSSIPCHLHFNVQLMFIDLKIFC